MTDLLSGSLDWDYLRLRLPERRSEQLVSYYDFPPRRLERENGFLNN